MIRGLQKILYGITVQQFHDHISKCLHKCRRFSCGNFNREGGLYEYFIYNKITNLKHLLSPWSKLSALSIIPLLLLKG